MISLSDLINATRAPNSMNDAGKMLMEGVKDLDADLTVGLVLGVFWMLSVMLGDDRLASLLLSGKSKKAAKLSPHTASTSLIIPLLSLLFAGWLEYAFIARVAMPFCGGWSNFCLTFLGWFGMAICVALVGFGYGWREPFEGLTINVREPKRQGKFGGMDYTCYKEDLGYSVFWSLFIFQLSSIVIPMELFIHQILGGDEDRAQEDGDNHICEGMMAQEMNHGKCQVLMSRAAEKTLSYPTGYRRIWKFLYFDFLPSGLVQAFVGIIEAGFITLTGMLAVYPPLYDFLFGEPRWVFKWHVTEESEHCWDSVQDILDRCPFVWRILMWTAAVPLLFLLFLPLTLIEGLAYGWRAFLANPLVIVTSFFTWGIFTPNFVMMMLACTFIHLVCGLRPSDKVYHFIRKQMHDEVFTPCRDEFKITHVQPPHEHLQLRRESMERRKSSIFARREGITNMERNGSIFGSLSTTLRRRSSMATSITSSLSANKRQSVAMVKSIKRLSNYRSSLYAETQRELREAGMSQVEIDDAGFGSSLIANMAIPEEAKNSLFSDSQLAELHELYEGTEGAGKKKEK